MPEETRKSAISLAPAKRLGTMEAVAYLVSFLASDGAGFINSAETPINGGMRLTMLYFGRAGRG